MVGAVGTPALGARLESLVYQIIRYYSISALALGIDLGLFQALIAAGRNAVMATTASYAVAAGFHFTVNRQWNFKAFHRPARRQLVTYGIIVVAAWAVNVAVIMLCTGRLGLAPLPAKLASVLVTLPMGFFGHKYLTYRHGITGAVRLLAARWRHERHAS